MPLPCSQPAETTLTDDLVFALQHAREHLQHYRAYAEDMRTIGRGTEPSSPFSPEYLDGIIANVIARATVAPVGTRYFVPCYIDHQQSNTYKLVGWTVRPDGQIIAHFGDGHTSPSIHPSIDHIRADVRIREVQHL